MFASVSRSYYFDAAHKVECLGQGHICGRLHGHTWKVKVTVSGKVNESSQVVLDYLDIDKAWAPVFAEIDHTYLNEVPGLEHPTTEVIAAFIWARMESALRCPSGHYQLSKLTIEEGATDVCELTGP